MPQPILFTIAGVHNALNGTGLRRGGVAPNFCGGRLPPQEPTRTISGVSRDSAGAPLAGCTCTLFRVATSGDVAVYTQLAVAVSDGGGNYSFVVGTDGPYRVTFDLDGAPARAGLTTKTLAGV